MSKLGWATGSGTQHTAPLPHRWEKDQPVLQGKPALLLLKGVYHGQQDLLVQNELLEYLQLLCGFRHIHTRGELLVWEEKCGYMKEYACSNYKVQTNIKTGEKKK